MPDKDDTPFELKRKIKRFRRLPDCGPFGGVCAGLAYWLAWPAWIIRLVWTLAVILYGVGFGIYLLLWIFVPAQHGIPGDYTEVTGHDPNGEDYSGNRR